MAYIELELAIRTIKGNGILGSGYSDEEREEDVIDMLSSIAGPIPHGHWIPVDELNDAFDCSECNIMVRKKHNFCPNCGIDMRKED